MWQQFRRQRAGQARRKRAAGEIIAREDDGGTRAVAPHDAREHLGLPLVIGPEAEDAIARRREHRQPARWREQRQAERLEASTDGEQRALGEVCANDKADAVGARRFEKLTHGKQRLRRFRILAREDGRQLD